MSTTQKDMFMYQYKSPVKKVCSLLLPIIIGSRLVTACGSVSKSICSKSLSSGGQTLHGGHGYAFYQIAEKARKFPLVFRQFRVIGENMGNYSGSP